MIRGQSNLLLNVSRRCGEINKPIALKGKLIQQSRLGQQSSLLFNDSRCRQTSVPGHLISLISSSSSRLFGHTTYDKCWQCKSHFDTKEAKTFCLNCQAPQPSDEGLNYFQVFDQSVNYDVDINKIREKYLFSQRLLHPDKFAGRSQEDQELSAYFSSLINKGYDVLINPYERGIYLLSLKGITIEENETDYKMDPEFLEDMITINEAILESNEEQLQAIKEDINAKINVLVQDVSSGFKSNSLDRVKVALCKLKFYTNIIEKVVQREE